MRRLAIVLTSLSFAQGLKIGDPAPAFRVEAMVKGEAPDLSKGVHVVDLWLTDNPFQATASRLSALARKYRGRVAFTGVEVSQYGEDLVGKARTEVRVRGERMDYNVAVDGTAQAVKKGFQGDGRLTFATYLIKDGTVLWIGSPSGRLEKAIEEVLGGTYDMAAARAARERELARQAELQSSFAKTGAPLLAVRNLLVTRRHEEALAALEAIRTDDPRERRQVDGLRRDALTYVGGPRLEKEAKAALADAGSARPADVFWAKAALGDPSALDQAKSILAGPLGKDEFTLSRMAWWILDPESKFLRPNYEAAAMLAEAAAKTSDMKDPRLLDRYALALSKAGRTGEAIATQGKAIALLKADGASPARLKPYEDRLEEIRKAKA